MGILSTRKNKKYAYIPRYYKSDKETSPFQIEPKFDKFRTTLGDDKSLKAKLIAAYDDLKDASDRKTNRTLWVIISILVLIFLYIIDFDLSIFTHN